MIKKILILSLFLVAFGSHSQAISFSSKPYIDPEQFENDRLYKKYKKEKCGIKYDSDCLDIVFKQWNSEGKFRGTNEYCDVHYVPASSSVLKSKYTELTKIKAGPGIPYREPGEVTQKDIDHELWCIAQILEERGELK